MNQNIKGTVLIIDDDPANIDVLGNMLRSDYKVLAATSGLKGLQLAQRLPQPDLVLLDIKMQGLDGYATCKELKQNEQTKNIAVIFVTADADIYSEERGLLLGAVDYITKPFNAMLVKARVRNHVLLKQGQDNLQLLVDQATAELRQEQGKLERSEKLYRTLMEAAPDSILLVNEQGDIEMANDSVEPMFGYKSLELVGNKIEVLVPDEFIAGHSQQRASFLQNPVIRSRVTLGKLSGKKKDGTVFPVDISLSPISMENGTMIIADIRDMTEEQRMQDQLRQAQKMEAIGQLTGGIAHDFNNILNSILGFSSIALNDEVVQENEELKSYLDIISKSGERARDLVKQMLSFSRGNYTGDFKPIDLAPVMHEVIKMIRPMLPASINVELDIEKNLPNSLADSLQINQVIMNMCINARDALHEQGNIILAVKKVIVKDEICNSCHEKLSTDFIEISISDNGEGISKENIEKIFDPFFTTKEVGKGSGMGLSVVHGIVHNHGGHIVVNSKPGEGTKFRLLLPYVNTRNTTQQSDVAATTLQLDGGSAHVMVVDDEALIGTYVETVLTEMNFRVTVFSDSNKALDYFQENSDDIDLVITDQTMPMMTGFELSKAMLEIKNGIPVIMQTGFSSIVDDKSARALGIRAFLNKPLDKNVLLNEIKVILNL